MHIGFDISQTGATKAGCGYYAHAMAEALLAAAPQHHFALYPSFGDFYFDADMPAGSPYRGRDVAYGPVHRSLEEARSFWLHPRLEDALGRPDVIHANNFWCPPQALCNARLVYTLYDLSFVDNPELTTEVNRAGCWGGVSRAAATADWIVAISNASRDHYLRVFPRFPADRMRVIPPCSRFAGWTREGTPPAALAGMAPRGFWLSVGTIEPRKNQRRIVQAYARYLALGGAAIPLVFAGGYGWLMDDFRAEVAALGVGASVVFTGYLNDDELAWLYRNCYAHVYASLFEGFGLPVLEGMQFGAPTIASNTTSIPEVAGDAALLVDPHDAEALARAMLRIDGERESLSARARERAPRFDWRASALALASLYGEALAAPKRAPAGATDSRWTGRLLRYGGRLYERAVRGFRPQ